MIRIAASYARSAVFPPGRIENLEQFFVSRFGRELYRLFFKSYTEKVWGVPCERISAEWGAQRIKGLSIMTSLRHLLAKAFGKSNDLSQKDTQTSLIEKFMYTALGPGQLWELVAGKVQAMGGTILTGRNVRCLRMEGDHVVSVVATDGCSEQVFDGDYFFSTMPVKDLAAALDPPAPANVRQISDRLEYRDFITVGLLLRKLAISEPGTPGTALRDNWIYIQEPEVMAGRLQIFNNWSPHLVKDPDTVWLGVEYFCHESDPLWTLGDKEMADFAARELHQIGIIQQEDVLDFTVVRVPKTYPAYFGAYEHFGDVRAYFDSIPNLFLVGRNGMHKYNNQDHSMLTAMTAVDNILVGRRDKSNIWAVNTEMEYHEEKREPSAVTPESTPVADAA